MRLRCISFPASMVAAKGCPSCSRQDYGPRSSRPRGASCLLLGLAAWVPRGRRFISSSSRKPPNCSVSPILKSPRQRSFRSPTRRASTSLLPPASRLSLVGIGTVGSQGNLFRRGLNEILRCAQDDTSFEKPGQSLQEGVERDPSLRSG